MMIGSCDSTAGDKRLFPLPRSLHFKCLEVGLNGHESWEPPDQRICKAKSGQPDQPAFGWGATATAAADAVDIGDAHAGFATTSPFNHFNIAIR